MPQILSLVRPAQWIKNVFVIAPLFFAHAYHSSAAWELMFYAVAAFTLATSVVYIINDIIDRDCDARHPTKRLRPLAAGHVSVGAASGVAVMCGVGCVWLLSYVPIMCAWLVAGYVAANIAYSLYIKKQAVLDVLFIASCFVLRVLVGCYAISVTISPWIIITTFMLALFLGFGKRYHEFGIEGYADTKENLQGYSLALLDKLVVISGTSALVSYTIYAAEMAGTTGDVRIVYTVLFVACGLFRYLQSVYVHNKGGEPEMVMLSDRWQWINGVLWFISTLYIYGFHAS